MVGAGTVPPNVGAHGGGRALSNCITTGLPAGMQTLSYRFRTTDPDVSSVGPK